MEETNGCNSAHHLNAPEDDVTMEEIMVMDKEISKVEARGEAVSPSILLFLYNTNYYKKEDEIMTKYEARQYSKTLYRIKRTRVHQSRSVMRMTKSDKSNHKSESSLLIFKGVSEWVMKNWRSTQK